MVSISLLLSTIYTEQRFVWVGEASDMERGIRGKGTMGLPGARREDHRGNIPPPPVEGSAHGVHEGPFERPSMHPVCSMVLAGCTRGARAPSKSRLDARHVRPNHTPMGHVAPNHQVRTPLGLPVASLLLRDAQHGLDVLVLPAILQGLVDVLEVVERNDAVHGELPLLVPVHHLRNEDLGI